jgi:hypothetical protein
MFAYGVILAIVLIVGLVGCLPIWPHSKNWGYYPIGVASVIMVVMIMFLKQFLWQSDNGIYATREKRFHW